jgi:hypothetical protein
MALTGKLRHSIRGEPIMTTIQAQLIGDDALVPRSDLERLLEIARRSEPVDLKWSHDDLATTDIMRLAERGGSFEFWNDAGEDIYSVDDGEPVQ